MLAHFLHPAVWVSYALVLGVSWFWFEYFHKPAILVLVSAGMSIALVVIDYTVHCSIHNWAQLRFPAPSVVWVCVLAIGLLNGFIVAPWQLVGIYLAQAVWDNSWHAVAHHHVKGEPRAELDHWFVRWGAAALAFGCVFVPWLYGFGQQGN